MKIFSNRLFIILLAFILITIGVLRVPYFKSQMSRQYRKGLLIQLQTDLKNDEFTAEKYWQFRERYSPGTFLRDEAHTDFFATFRITSTQEEGLTALLFYESPRLRSLDAVVHESNNVIKNIKNEFEGEVLYHSDERILIKSNNNEYVFAFVESIKTMEAVNGMFDYTSAELELLKNKKWYNATYISLN